MWVEALQQLQHALRSLQTRFVGHRMGGFDNLDPLAGRTVSIARDDQTFEMAGPVGIVRLQRLRHGRGCLACANHDHTAATHAWQFFDLRQVGRHADLGLRAGHSGVKQAAQERAAGAGGDVVHGRSIFAWSARCRVNGPVGVAST